MSKEKATKSGRGGAREGAGRPRGDVDIARVSAGLPAPLAEKLAAWCREHDSNTNQAINRAVSELVGA